MKKLLTFLFILSILNSCSDSTKDDPQEVQFYDAPLVRSYVTYISQNSVMLNGFIDHSNITFLEKDSFNVGFVFRSGNQNDSSNDKVIEIEGEVDYFNGTYYFNTKIDSLEPNTTYYYTAYTQNGSSKEDDWKSFTTSNTPCSQTRNNYLNISGAWQSVSVEITKPQCCDEGNVGFRFGKWPEIYEVTFNELDNEYPNTGEYFGVDYRFIATNIEKELAMSTNEVLIGNSSTPTTKLFVENDGETITLIFCNTILRNGTTLNGKVSVSIQ